MDYRKRFYYILFFLSIGLVWVRRKKANANFGLLTNTKDGYINAEFYLTEKQNKLQSLGPIVLICHHHQQTIITCLLNL